MRQIREREEEGDFNRKEGGKEEKRIKEEKSENIAEKGEIKRRRSKKEKEGEYR